MCNVTDYQLWRGPSSETQGQLVGAGKNFEEKIRAKKCQGLLTFLRPNFFSPVQTLKNSGEEKSRTFDFCSPQFFSRPFRLFPAPTNSSCVFVHVEGPGAIPCKAQADQSIWQGFLGRDDTSCVRLDTNNILSQVLLSTFFLISKLKLKKSPFDILD